MRTTLCCFAVAAVILMSAAYGMAEEMAAVAVVSYDVEPAVFFPGDEGIITVTLKNTATQSSVTEENYRPGYGGGYTRTTYTTTGSEEIECVRLISGGDCVEWIEAHTRRISEYRNIGALGPGESISISFPVRVRSFCRDATYFPIVSVDVEKGKDVRFPVPVRVDSSALNMIFEEIPPEISPGEAKEIRLTVANNRPSSLSGVCISVTSDECIEITPERVFIGNIGKYERKSVNFTISAVCHGTNAAAETKKIVFEASYKNGDNEHKSTVEANVLLRDVLDVHLILVHAPASVKRGEHVRIEFDVANGMEKPISAVSVVHCAPDVRILPSESFIGDMNAGDVFSASFTVYSETLGTGENTLKFKLRFRDTTGRLYETPPYDVRIFVEEPDETPSQMPVFAIAAIASVMMAVLFFVMRKRRRT